MKLPPDLFSCNKCGWVHMGVSTVDGGDQCLGCFRCGNPHTNFRPTSGAEVPMGSTIQAILYDAPPSAPAIESGAPKVKRSLKHGKKER